MNMAPKKRTSVARKVHIPSVAASFCCGIASNCSCSAAWTSAMDHLLLSFGRVLIRRMINDRNFLEIMLSRRRGRLPFETGRVPGIGGRALAVFERPDEIDQGQDVADAQDGSA